MNFVDDSIVIKLVPSSANLQPKALNKVVEKTNGLVYRVAKTALDTVRIYAGGSVTIKPEHFHNVAKIAQILRMPVSCDKPDSSMTMLRGGGCLCSGGGLGNATRGGNGVSDVSAISDAGTDLPAFIRQPITANTDAFGIAQKGGNPVLPMRYFQHGGDPVLPMRYFQQGGDPVLPMRYFQQGGDPVLPMRYFQEGGDPVLPMRYFQEGGQGDDAGKGTKLHDTTGLGMRDYLPDAVIVAVVKEYKARSGCPDLRMTDAARAVLRTLVEANVSKALSSKHFKPSAAAIDKITRHWTLVL